LQQITKLEGMVFYTSKHMHVNPQ